MKRKQIIVLGLVTVIILVAVVRYKYGGVGESVKTNGFENLTLTQSTNLEDIPGAATYVNSIGVGVTQELLTNASQPTGYFAGAKMERDKARSKQKEELKAMVQSSDDTVTASSTLSSAEAQEQLVSLIRRSETESTIETLIKQRGFEDAMVYMSDTGNIDVIIKASSLSSKEVAQISDIVTRHTDTTMDCITVKNVN